jgi:hypothetical protein
MEKSKRNTYIAVAVVAVLIISLLVPSDNTIGRISSGRLVNPGVVESIDSSHSNTTIRLSAPAEGYFFVIHGSPENYYVGQKVTVSLTHDLFPFESQSVQVSYNKNENLFMRVFRSLWPIAADKKELVDVYHEMGIPDKVFASWVAS